MSEKEKKQTKRDRMRKNIKKHGWKGIGIIVIIILPFITECIIKYGMYRPNSFKNEEWFSFMGSYLGAVVTVIVMYITFRKNDKDRKEELQFQLRKRTMEIQKDAIRRICDILLMTHYSFANRYNVTDDLSRFSRDLQSIGLSTLFAKYDEYRTKERDALITILLEIQAEQVRILKDFQENAVHVETPESAEQRIDETLCLGCELKKTAAKYRGQIAILLDSYLKSVEKSIYSSYE